MAGQPKRAALGVELVKRGIVTEADIKTALDYQREHSDKKIGEILHILNLVPERTLIRALGEILGEKVIILTKEALKVQSTDYISIDVSRNCRAIIFDVVAGKAKVCFSDTANKDAMNQIKSLLLHHGLVMDRYLTFDSKIQEIIDELGGKTGDNIAASNDIVGLVDTIMKTAFEKRTSDVHIEPLENNIRVRFRVDGDLITVANIPKSKQAQLVGRLKAISNMHQEKLTSQDGRITIYNDYNIRVSSQPNVNGEKFCLRLLKKNAGIKNIFDLGFPNDEKILKASFDKRNSITLVAAPTGEGKTTTLYSILDYLNKPSINITTVEDPVEIRVSGINQVEIDPKTKSTFASSLRTILRQDPDIILVGEIRDLETAEIAMQAGQTGHYVLSTIHTINAVEVITRLRKMGISDYDISSTLATAVSQRLIRKICPHCCEERPFTEEEKTIMNRLGGKYDVHFDFTGKHTYNAVGCAKCNHTGYLGRIAAFEILEITEELRELITAGQSSMIIRDQALKGGYKPLAIDALKKVHEGIITLEEANKKLVLYN